MRTLIIIISSISFILTIDLNAESGYEWQYLLPLSFLLLYTFIAPSTKNFGVGYLVLNIIWLIRFCITPVFIRLSDYHIRYYANMYDKDLYIAQFLMFIELLVSILVCRFFYDKFVKSDNRHIKNRNHIESQRDDRLFKKVSTSVLLIMVSLSIFVLALDRNAINGFNFILNNEFVQKGNPSLGISVLILSWTKIVITVFLVAVFGVREAKKRNPLNVIFSIIVVLISISIFNGTSRNEILIEALAYIYLLIRTFPKYKKSVSIFCISALVVILLSVTTTRYFNTQNLTEGLSNYDTEGIAVMLNSYFAGQQNVAIGVSSLNLYGDEYGISTLFKDLFANSILINKFTPDVPGTVDIFNLAVYNHSQWADQISPTITQALGLFSVLGIFIPALMVYFVLKIDMYSKKTPYIFGMFLATFIATNLAFYSPGNITIISTAITNRFIPLYIIYRITRIYIIRHR